MVKTSIMKLTAIIIALLICFSVQGQNLVVYGKDSAGKQPPVAIRKPDSTWKVNDAGAGLETLYDLYMKLHNKHQALLVIIGLLGTSGCPTDMKKFNEAVANYNQLISR
jgi:hypothetical protein